MCFTNKIFSNKLDLVDTTCSIIAAELHTKISFQSYQSDTYKYDKYSQT